MAALEITNNPNVNSKRKKSRSALLTTKQTYLWAALLAHVAESAPNVTSENVISAATVRGLSRNDIKRVYEEFSSTYESEETTKRSAPDVLGATIRALGLNVTTHQLTNSAKAAYESLLRKGLIEDPLEILVGGIAVAVVGLLPVSFTRRRRPGSRFRRN
jgi:hypothetical protein